MAKHITRKPRVYKDGKGLYYKVKGRKVRLRLKAGKIGRKGHKSVHKNNHISIGSIQRAVFHTAPAVKRRRRKKPVTKEQIKATASSIASNLPEAWGFSNQLGQQLGLQQSYALSNTNREQMLGLEHKLNETKGDSVKIRKELQNLLDAPAALNRADGIQLYYDIKTEINDVKKQVDSMANPTRPKPPASPFRGIAGLLRHPLSMFSDTSEPTSGDSPFVYTSQWGTLGDDKDEEAPSIPSASSSAFASATSDDKKEKKTRESTGASPYIDPELYLPEEEQPDALRALIGREMTFGAVMAKLTALGKGPVSHRGKILLPRRNARDLNFPTVAKAIMDQGRFDLLNPLPEDNKMSKKGKGDGTSGEGITDKFIIKHMKPYRSVGWQGVIMSDEIHTLKPLPETSFIMNLGPSTTNGYHWVACYVSCLDDCTIEYYDSLAGKMPRRFLRDVKKYIIDPLHHDEAPCMLKVKENSVADQSARSDTCGFFAMKFLIDRYAGKSFRAASGYRSIAEGEKQVKAFKKYV